MIPLGLNKNGELLAADQVPRGLNCGLVCPVCRTELVARQGEIKAWHFAHYGDGASGHGACGEGALHISAKEIIRKSVGKYLILPSSIQRWSKQPQGAVPLPSTKRFRIQSVDIEKHFSAIDRRVDAWILMSSDPSHQTMEVGLEFNVHHAKDSDTIEAFEEANLSVLEVDLSYDKILEISEREGLSIVEALRILILAHTANKRWLSHGDYGKNLSCVHPGLDDCGKPRCDCTCSFCVGEITQINANIEAQQTEKKRLRGVRQRLTNPVILRGIIEKALEGTRDKNLSLSRDFRGWSKAPEGAKAFESDISTQFLIKSLQLDKVLKTGKRVDAFISLAVRDDTNTRVRTTDVIVQFDNLDKDENAAISIKDFEQEGVSALHFEFDFDKILSWMEGKPSVPVESQVRRYFLQCKKSWLYHSKFGAPLDCEHPYHLQRPHGCKCPCRGCELMRERHTGWQGQFGCVKCGALVEKPYIQCYNCNRSRRDP